MSGGKMERLIQKSMKNPNFKKNHVKAPKKQEGQKLYKSLTKVKESKLKIIHDLSAYLDVKKKYR